MNCLYNNGAFGRLSKPRETTSGCRPMKNKRPEYSSSCHVRVVTAAIQHCVQACGLLKASSRLLPTGSSRSPLHYGYTLCCDERMSICSKYSADEEPTTLNLISFTFCLSHDSCNVIHPLLLLASPAHQCASQIDRQPASL
jgi:hypothetical protein